MASTAWFWRGLFPRTRGQSLANCRLVGHVSAPPMIPPRPEGSSPSAEGQRSSSMKTANSVQKARNARQVVYYICFAHQASRWGPALCPAELKQPSFQHARLLVVYLTPRGMTSPACLHVMYPSDLIRLIEGRSLCAYLRRSAMLCRVRRKLMTCMQRCATTWHFRCTLAFNLTSIYHCCQL